MEADPVMLSESEKLRTGKPHRLLRRIGGALLLTVAVVVFWRFLSHSTDQVIPSSPSGTSQGTKTITVTLLSVAPAVTPQWLEVTGTVQAELEAPIASKVMGRVQNVLAKEGDRVRRNQPLIQLDAQDLEAVVAQASANLRASSIGYENARVTARMEASLSAARIEEAHAKVTRSEAALQAAKSKLELLQAGPRHQEREQAILAVSQAKSNLTFAENNMKRMAALYADDAISAQQYEQYKTQYEVAKAQFETAQQGRSIAEEGSRAEDIRAAQQAALQAQAAVQEAYAGLNTAQASALQAKIRQQEIQNAQAQIGQSRAGLQLAKVTRGYATIVAPFDGTITRRVADPGAMASPGVPLLQLQGGAL